LSGPGLAQLDAWLGERTGRPSARDGVEIIAAAEKGEALACETLRLFTRILGRVTGDLILTHLPYGGVFLAGGVARAVAPWLMAPEFAAALYEKGRFGDFLRVFPVSVLCDDYAALTGCARYLALTQG
jgi:glucokinase